MPQRQLPIRPRRGGLFLPFPLSFPRTAHLSAQGIERRRPWRHGTLQPASGGPRCMRYMGHFPRWLLLQVQGLRIVEFHPVVIRRT